MKKRIEIEEFGLNPIEFSSVANACVSVGIFKNYTMKHLRAELGSRQESYKVNGVICTLVGDTVPYNEKNGWHTEVIRQRMTEQ